MSTLQGKYLRDTYKDLLQISNSNIGVDDTARFIEDGEGTPSILAISTTRVGVGTDTPAHTLDVAGDINLTGSLKVNGADAVFSNWTVNGSDIYRSTGSVGIGTDSPDEELHILAPAQPYLKIEATDASESGVLLARQSMNTWRIINRPDQSDSLAIQGNGATIDQFVTITQGGNVGIGTTNPGGKLHINDGTGTPPVFASDDYIVIQNNSNVSDTARLTIISGTEGLSRIGFGDSGLRDSGRITYNNSDNSLSFGTSGTNEHMCIDSTGNVGIGTATPDHQLTIKSSLNHGCIRLTTNASTDNHIRYDYPSNSSKYWLVGVDQTNTLADSFLVYNSSRNDVDLIIDQATGNVGIGTVALPQYKLTISGGHLQLHSSTHLTALDGNAYRQAIGWSAAASSDVMNAFINCEDVGSWGGKLQFWTRGQNGGEAVRGMTILGGHVGIGDSDPGSALSILNTSTASVDAITLKYEHLSNLGGLEQRIKWRFGDDATPDAPSDAAYIAVGKQGAWTHGPDRNAYISFATAHGSNQVLAGGSEPDYTAVERFRILSDGQHVYKATTSSQDDMTTLRRGFYIGANVRRRVRIILSNYEAAYIRVAAQRTNSGDSMVWYHGYFSYNHDERYTNAVSNRVSSGTITMTPVSYISGDKAYYDIDFNVSASPAKGSIVVESVAGQPTVQVTTY